MKVNKLLAAAEVPIFPDLSPQEFVKFYSKTRLLVFFELTIVI